MGDTRIPHFITPLVAMLAGDAEHFNSALAPLRELLGPVELESPVYPFDKTEYYAQTMGPALKRKFLVFKKLADPGNLPAWKLAANALERELAVSLTGGDAREVVQRPINLDPGYLSGAKLVLASTKDFAHRIYLRDGIFAEITLGFRGDAWVGHAYTFPDFKSGLYDAFLTQARAGHLRKCKLRGAT